MPPLDSRTIRILAQLAREPILEDAEEHHPNEGADLPELHETQ